MITGTDLREPRTLKVMLRVIEQMHMREVTIAFGMTETRYDRDERYGIQSSINDLIERRVSIVGKSTPHI